MKRYILLLCISCFTLPLIAQLSVGIKGGYGSHGVHFEPPSLEANQVAYGLMNYGFVLAFNNKLNSGLQMELNYAQKGWREELTTPDSFFIRTINYLEMPIFSHFEIGHGPLRPVILAGFYFGLKMNESADSNNYTDITSASSYNPYYQEIRDLDFGIKLGIGLRYNINSRMAIFSEVRYDVQIAGGRDIFIDRPNGIQASRLKEIGGVFGILWHIIPQEKNVIKKGYTPKEDLYDFSQ